jgi:hypothetical protein
MARWDMAAARPATTMALTAALGEASQEVPA